MNWKMMQKIWAFCMLFCLSAWRPAMQSDGRLYELRICTAMPGQVEALAERLKTQQKFYKKHGITAVGYWQPLDNTSNQLIYLLSYPSKAAREKAWQSFEADKTWLKIREEEAQKPAVLAGFETLYLQTTDFSPNALQALGNRVFELRTYKTPPQRLPHLMERFRSFTLNLFAKHGMSNIIYFTPTADTPGSEDMLYYFLAHPSKEAGLQAFRTFVADPEWQTVRKNSEEKAGGTLTLTIKSEYMRALDFSPLQ
jgi:NIPSNAP